MINLRTKEAKIFAYHTILVFPSPKGNLQRQVVYYRFHHL